LEYYKSFLGQFLVIIFFIYKDLNRVATAPPTPGHLCHIAPTMSNGSSSGSHKKEMVLAQVSLVMVLIFVLSHSIKWVPNIYELLQVLNNVTVFVTIYFKENLNECNDHRYRKFTGITNLLNYLVPNCLFTTQIFTFMTMPRL
jgi:hypothetical protein